MLTNLMNYIFVFSIGVFIGVLIAFEIFQKQLKNFINNRDAKFNEFLTCYDWHLPVKKEGE